MLALQLLGRYIRAFKIYSVYLCFMTFIYLASWYRTA